MDNAATTRMKPQVLQEMMPYMTDKYGNPSESVREYFRQIFSEILYCPFCRQEVIHLSP